MGKGNSPSASRHRCAKLECSERLHGGTFKVDDIDRTSITVSSGNMQMPRRVSKGEFEKLHAIWDTYRSGNYPRSKMLSLSQKYHLHPQHPAPDRTMSDVHRATPV